VISSRIARLLNSGALLAARGVMLTIIDDTNRQLDIDQNGDSAIDGTISTAWGEL
jgi:hypothetical protein